MRRDLFALLTLLALACDRPAPPDESDKIFDQSFVHEIELTVAPGDLAQLSPDNDLRVPCTFRFDGIDSPDVLAKSLGWEHVVYGSASMNAAIEEPGVIRQRKPNSAVTEAEANGEQSARLLAIKAIF